MSTLKPAATTQAHEHWQLDCPECKGNGFIAGQACPRCTHPLSPAGLAAIGIASPDLETRALSMLTDDQAMASFIRWRTALHGAKALESIRTAADVSEYVAAIFAKVPHG